MRESNYNFFIKNEENNGVIAYNSFTSAMAMMNNEEFERFNSSKENDFDSCEEETIKLLKNNGYIIEDDYKELDAIECDFLNAKYSNNFMVLTIAPTEDCNFRCIYCYEKNSIKPKYMDIKTADNVVSYIKKRIKDIRGLKINWYGGEPLLSMNIIKNISESVIKLCDENNVYFDASIVTNGYFLNEKNLDVLSSCKVKSIQVTIDGNKEIHDKRRFLNGGGPTFDTIIKNLRLIKNYDVNVNLRVNIDKTNVHIVEEVTNIIKKINGGKNISCYLGMVTSTDGCYKKSECFNTEEFSYKNLDFHIKNYEDISYMYPNIRKLACGAEGTFSLVIGADGETYKCWEDMGKKDLSTGNINGEISFYNKNNIRYLSNNPINHKSCRECKVLPLCMGGCLKKIKGEDACDVIKYTLESVIKEIYVANKV